MQTSNSIPNVKRRRICYANESSFGYTLSITKVLRILSTGLCEKLFLPYSSPPKTQYTCFYSPTANHATTSYIFPPFAFSEKPTTPHARKNIHQKEGLACVIIPEPAHVREQLRRRFIASFVPADEKWICHALLIPPHACLRKIARKKGPRVAGERRWSLR